jgi:hypothetical protein
MKVFLGGTCGDSTWRDELTPMLEIDYFNPVVDNWTPECQKEEIKQREECDYCLYVLTPQMVGVYSIAEVVEDSIKRPHKTVLGILEIHNGISFDEKMLKSLYAVSNMVEKNNAKVFFNLQDIAAYLNK